MLIVNDDHCLLAGVSSLSERCNYCSKPLTHYPLILSDDANQTVYHAACAIELGTEIMVDVFTFFSPLLRLTRCMFSQHLKQLAYQCDPDEKVRRAI